MTSHVIIAVGKFGGYKKAFNRKGRKERHSIACGFGLHARDDGIPLA
jgi:hypothetical protein